MEQPTAQLADADIEELAHLCKQPHGLSDTALSPQVLAAAHVPLSDDAGAVALKSLRHVSDVNALAPGEMIQFAPSGLTVIYGNNGAGKSGYSRILKRACRARGTGEPVLPNALSETPAGRPTAQIVFSVADKEQTHTWRDGEASPRDLGAVSVFDAAAASVYVAKQTDVAFRPFGLDVLDRLAQACNDIRDRLDRERAQLERQAVVLPNFPPQTKAGRLMSALSSLTRPEDVEALAKLTPEEEAERERLAAVVNAARAEDPAKRADEIRQRAARLRKLHQFVLAIDSALAPKSLQELRAQHEIAAAASAAADAAKASFEKDGLLPGVGGDAWRALWEAARAYSTQTVYPGQRFPVTGDDAKCLLCQQPFHADAAAHLAAFEEFVSNTVQAKARKAKADVAERLAALDGLAKTAGNHRTTVEELATADHAAGDAVATYLAAAANFLASIGATTTAATPFAAASPSALLTSVIERLELHARDLVKTADPAQRRAVEERLAELQARVQLAENKSVVLAEIRRKTTVNAYEKCIKDAGTNTITRKSTELTKKYVTEALSTAFDEELKKVGFTYQELVLKAVRGQVGALMHQITFKYATKAELPRIASEGEARCLSLAAFLAELRLSGSASAIVFDDPVSSLAHEWRQQVARRLVDEAKARQVVVFTHEMVFLRELQLGAEKMQVPFKCQWIFRERGTSGHVADDLPWLAQPVRRRLGSLRNEWQAAEKVFRTGERSVYEALATRIYGRLRQTWERAIEEVLLCNVVMRFRDGIETKRLSQLTDITDADNIAVDDGMTKCSKWEGGHDQALAVNEPIPAPDEVQKDIGVLEAWIDAIENRRKKKK
jgi:ABC-type uncharacterized transport system ATPase subunit